MPRRRCCPAALYLCNLSWCRHWSRSNPWNVREIGFDESHRARLVVQIEHGRRVVAGCRFRLGLGRYHLFDGAEVVVRQLLDFEPKPRRWRIVTVAQQKMR